MKKIFIIFLLLSYMGISSCIITTKKEGDSDKKEVTEKTACDEFLEEYEELMDQYLQVIEDYFNNPSDEVTASNYMELMQKTMEYNNKWENLIDCADDEQYRSEFEAISKQVEEKLVELGL